MSSSESNYQRAIELLKDAWSQFAVRENNGNLWAGGLSTLEDIQEFLINIGELD